MAVENLTFFDIFAFRHFLTFEIFNFDFFRIDIFTFDHIFFDVFHFGIFGFDVLMKRTIMAPGLQFQNVHL